MTLQITVNGDPAEVPAETTIGSWLANLGRDPQVVAVERNGEIVPRASFSATPLADGDRLEIVQFVQGG